jgi:hypothetical protein
LLLGIATFKGTDLIEFRGKGIQSVSSFGVIGCGDSSLIRYLADSAEKFWITLQEGFLLSAYILKRAEEYIDGCHGPMDFACLTQGPKMTIIEPSIIEKVDGLMKENQPKAFRDLLSIAWTLPT